MTRKIGELPKPVEDTEDEDFLLLDPGDWIDLADRVALHHALVSSQEDIEAGRLFDAEEVLRELRAL